MMKVVCVNAGPAVTVDIGAEPVSTAIFKYPVSGRVSVRGANLAGDDQADRENHGGPDRALYAYASEDIAWWRQALERADIVAGMFGENLTTIGLDVNAALIGERWRIGTALFEVSQPRVPCFKLAMRLNEPRIVRLFAKSLRTGTYLRIIEEGAIGAGDPIEIAFRPEHDVSIRDFAEIYFSKREDAGRLLQTDALSDDWRAWAMQQNEP